MHARVLLFSMVAACTPTRPTTSRAAEPIVNGEPTGEFASTVLLVSAGNPVCSGTLIGCDRVLTAAHCVCDGEGADCQGSSVGAGLLVYLQHAGFVPVVGGRVHPDYSFPDDDIAILHLVDPVTSVAPTPIASVPWSEGDEGVIVGYGRSGGALMDYGIKQVGGVTTGPCPPEASNPGHICWQFAGDGANTCNGDSGGPLFVERSGVVEVAGITSGGTSDDCLAGDWSYDNDVFALADFVGEVLGDEVTGGPACGALAPLGVDGATTGNKQGQLGAGERALLSVEVPVGTAELRIALNATAGAAIDLFARAGAEPSGGAPLDDCVAAGPSALGACVLEGPASGTWQVAIDAASVASYQLTTVVLAGGPAVMDDAYEVVDGARLEIAAAAGVLANDDGATDPEVVREPAAGTVELGEDGAFTYTPVTGFADEDSFTYRARSGDVAAGATVRVAIAPPGPDAGLEPYDFGEGCGCRSAGHPAWTWSALVVVASLGLRRRRRRDSIAR